MTSEETGHQVFSWVHLNLNIDQHGMKISLVDLALYFPSKQVTLDLFLFWNF